MRVEGDGEPSEQLLHLHRLSIVEHVLPVWAASLRKPPPMAYKRIRMGRLCCLERNFYLEHAVALDPRAKSRLISLRLHQGCKRFRKHVLVDLRIV